MKFGDNMKFKINYFNLIIGILYLILGVLSILSLVRSINLIEPDYFIFFVFLISFFISSLNLTSIILRFKRTKDLSRSGLVCHSIILVISLIFLIYEPINHFNDTVNTFKSFGVYLHIGLAFIFIVELLKMSNSLKRRPKNAMRLWMKSKFIASLYCFIMIISLMVLTFIGLFKADLINPIIALMVIAFSNFIYGVVLFVFDVVIYNKVKAMSNSNKNKTVIPDNE